jgi:hypothetical protein
MNEIDELARLRDCVPLSVTPRAEQLFRAGLREQRPVAPHHRNPLPRVRPSWRLGVAVAAVAALAAGIVVAVLPSAPVVLTAQLLADRASAAALTQPAVNPGQWVYRVVESGGKLQRSKGMPNTFTEAGWETADGEVTYGNNGSGGVEDGAPIPSYSELASLPRDPAALDAYLVRLSYTDPNEAQGAKGTSAFPAIAEMLANYVLPPALQAEMYQALAIIPGIQVDSHATAIDGQTGVAFVLPRPHGGKLEIILNASDYSFLARASWNHLMFHETAVVRMAIVGAPASTQPSLTPPTPAELLAEQADMAVSSVSTVPLYAEPSSWVMRKLATATGDQTVWATADDSEQASYVDGGLQVCSRSAACAKATQWLMPEGPGYALVNRLPSTGPTLPASLPQLLASLNSYPAGCADVAGDCNAVNAMANIIFGYVNLGGTDGDWFLMLAGIPGVTVQRVTDVTGQADLAFRFPFTDGITEILLNASTYQLVGYVRDGVETIITKEVTVSGPGSITPVVIQVKPLA